MASSLTSVLTSSFEVKEDPVQCISTKRRHLVHILMLATSAVPVDVIDTFTIEAQLCHKDVVEAGRGATPTPKHRLR